MSRAVLLDRTHRHEEAIADITTAIDIMELGPKSKSVIHSPVQLSEMRGGNGGGGEGGEEEITIIIKSNRAIEENKNKTVKISSGVSIDAQKVVEEGNKEERDRASGNCLIKFLTYRASFFLKTQRYSEAISDLSAAIEISENNKSSELAIHGFKTDIMKINLHFI